MPEKTSQYYFAYGSNMDQAQMTERCPGAAIVGMAKLPGYRFIINGRGVATVVPDRSHRVFGIVWSTTESHEQALDSYKGVGYGTYVKVRTRIHIGPKESVSALVYIAEDNSKGSPKAGYMERIIGAAELHKLPDTYLEELRTWL